MCCFFDKLFVLALNQYSDIRFGAGRTHDYPPLAGKLAFGFLISFKKYIVVHQLALLQVVRRDVYLNVRIGRKKISCTCTLSMLSSRMAHSSIIAVS